MIRVVLNGFEELWGGAAGQGRCCEGSAPMIGRRLGPYEITAALGAGGDG